MIEIKSYGPAWEELHRQFASKYWAKRKRLTPEYIYWKFRGTPGKDLPSFILAIENGKVVGQMGLVPCIVNIKGHHIEAQWACDLMVDKAYRGAGIAKALYDFAYLMKPLTLGSDASPAATISMIRAGFILLRGPWKFLYTLRLGELTKLKGINSSLLNRIRNPFTYLLLTWRFFRKLKQKFEIVGIEPYTDCANTSSKNKKISVLHDLPFAHWRYNSYKDYYKGLRLYSKGLDSHFSVYADKDLFIVTDWGAKNSIQYIDLWSEIVARAYQEKISRIKVMANSSVEKNTLQFSGAIKFRTRTQIIYYTKDNNISEMISNEYFYYTYMDSDENI
jgi:GNAT superfamily N-acetyltransferase